MITLQAQPGSVAFSRNEMLFRFYCTADDGEMFGPKGVRSQLDMSTNFALDPGDTLAVVWTEANGEEQTVLFTAADDPDAEDQLPTLSSPGIGFTYYSYWSAVAAKIQAYHLVAPFFMVYAMNNGPSPADLWIRALVISDDWQVTWDASGVSNSNKTVTDYPTTVADNTPDNYRVLFDLFFETGYLSGNFTRILQAYGIPGADGLVRIPVDEVIDRALVASRSDLPIPAFGDNEPLKADVLRRYYVRYRESYDDLVDPAWTNGPVKTVMCGGISQSLWATYDFLGNLSNTNSLLTWFPDKKRISKDQPEWIGWYNYTAGDLEVVLEVNQTNAAGNLPAEYKHIANGVIVAPGEVLLIPVGYAQLELDDADEVQRYSVRVVDAASDYEGEDSNPTYLSQERTYYLDDRYYLEKRYLMYLNGFCLPETLRCVGNRTHEIDVEREKSSRILQENYTAASPQIFQWRDSHQNRFTYRSGFLRPAEVDALTELLVYNQLWEVYEEGYIPLDVQDDRFRIRESRDTLFAITFRAIPKLKPRNYSNILIPMEVGQDAWLTDPEQYWQTIYGLPWETP